MSGVLNFTLFFPTLHFFHNPSEFVNKMLNFKSYLTFLTILLIFAKVSCFSRAITIRYSTRHCVEYYNEFIVLDTDSTVLDTPKYIKITKGYEKNVDNYTKEW